MASPEYLAFLDANLTEIANEGKPPPAPADTFAAGCQQIAGNLKAARFPGRKARVEADRRWAQVRQLEEAAK